MFTKKYMSRFICFLLLSAMLLPALAGCGQKENADPWNSGSKIVKVACVGGIDAQYDLLDKFTEETGIEVELTEMGIDDLHTKVTSGFAAGNLDYDLIWSYATTTAEWAEAGYLEDITDRITPELKEDLNPGSFDAVVYKGKFYGLPRIASVNILWYNKEVLRQSGLDPDSPPETWEELVSMAQQCNQNGNSGIVFSYGSPYGSTIQWELAQYLCGGQLVDENDNVVFNDESGIKAMNMLKEFFDLGIVEPSSLSNPGGWEQQQAFIKGKTAFTICWANTYAHAGNPEISLMDTEDLGWTTIPTVDGKTASVSGSEGYVISKYAQNKDNALKLLEFLASPESQKALCADCMFPPVRLSLYDDPEMNELIPALPAFKKQAEGYSNRFAAPYGVEFTDALQSEVVNCLSGKKTAEQALNDAEAKCKEIVEEYKKSRDS